ncbi:hypothetical protein J4456_01565 [Candidatus Pacearchaeota archaeon]|nr:hypothetical protein [Candidatus Pacearchaeota archaeon]
MTQENYYLPQAEDSIIKKIRENGWNIYNSANSSERGADEIISAGPVEHLQLLERYALMPLVQDAKNPKKVFEALEKFALNNNRQTPTIRIKYERYPWTGFIPREQDLKVNTIIGHYISYEEFVKALDSIQDIRKWII